MLKRPTSRRKGEPEQVVLNLVPILDTMVTLISFLLFTMSFIAIVSIESPFPQVSADKSKTEEKILEKPLQLTITLKENETEVWSPFGKIESTTIPNQTDGLPDTQKLHHTLVEIKQKFSTEDQIVIAPHAGASYDTLVAVMDAARRIEATDPPIYRRNQETGIDEVVKALFPNVVFGNILGDS